MAKSGLADALEQYGRLIKTNFLLRYIDEQELQKTIRNQLNKGEKANGLQGFIFLAHEGKLRLSDYDADLAPTWTPGSPACGQRDRADVHSEIAVAWTPGSLGCGQRDRGPRDAADGSDVTP